METQTQTRATRSRPWARTIERQAKRNSVELSWPAPQETRPQTPPVEVLERLASSLDNSENKNLAALARRITERLAAADSEDSFELLVTYELFDDDDYDQFLDTGGMSWTFDAAVRSGDFRSWIFAAAASQVILDQVATPALIVLGDRVPAAPLSSADFLETLSPLVRHAVYESYVAHLCCLTLILRGEKMRHDMKTLFLRRIASGNNAYFGWLLGLVDLFEVELPDVVRKEFERLNVQAIDLDADFERWQAEKAIIAEHCRSAVPLSG